MLISKSKYNMRDYIQKENYITIHEDPEIWRTHANYFIIRFYSHLLRGKVCDLGCNMGACTLLLLDFADNIEIIYGFDINYEALKIAFDTANKMSPKVLVNFVAANILDIPANSDTFDFAMSFHTLEHIYPEDAAKFVKESLRILKPGGHMLISIPYEKAYPDPTHVAFYNVESLTQLFEDNGFITIECMKDNRWREKNLLTGLFYKPT